MKSYKKYFIETSAFIFILLFTYSALIKIVDYDNFVRVIGKSPLLTDYASYIGISIPAIEIVIAVMFFFPKWRVASLLASFTLMLCFTFYISAILLYGKHIPCACGGVIENLGWRGHLVFNIVLCAIGFYAYYWAAKDAGQDSHTSTGNKDFIAIERGSRKPLPE